MKHHFALTIVLGALLVWQNCLAAEVPRHEADVCVYGGTASGVMAALAAEQEGSKVILIEPSRWLGGMTGGGINHLDWGKGSTVGGSTYKILMEGLGVKEQKHHGGHAIQGIGNRQYRERFKKIVEDRGITVIYEHRLGTVQVGDTTIDSPTRQKPMAMDESFKENKAGQSIRSITLDYAPFDKTGCPIPEPKKRNAITVSAKVFIDCSYEGDVLAMSGARYTWGRESREKYGESLAGVRPDLWVHDIAPYIEPGNPESGLLPFIQDRKIGPLGSADDLTMGYCFRYEFDMSGKGIPVPEPENYDPAEFEVYRRAIRDGIDIFSNRKMGKTVGKVTTQKRGPFVGGGQLNRNLMASTVHGCNDDYPNGDWATRARIWKFHQEFLSKSIHFAKTDPLAPESMKRHASRISFRKGVFDETGGWPHQLYIRQARRMVSSYVVTQNDLEGKTDPPHTVGLAAYGVDDFPYTVVVEDGKVVVQGGDFSIVYLDDGKYNGSYKIPYEAIVPRKGECDNLIVPVCVSASHIAFTSLRMEPVWMVLGESAGVAAAMAVDAEIPVQDVPYDKLRQKLDDLEQTLDRIPAQDPIKPGQAVRWKSQEQWNQQKPGYEWLFPHIDTNADGQISAEEYEAFQKLKAKNKDWEASLKNKGEKAPQKKSDRTPTGQRTERKPNIIFIMADDLGWKDVGFMGAEFFETPHIDKLARQGMSFTAAYTGGSNCAPTRACLMTGTYTPRHKIYTPGGLSKGNPEYMRLLVPTQDRKDNALNKQAAKQFVISRRLAPSFTCIPELLGPAGYRTARLGKWHLGGDTQGFDLSSANGKGGPDGSYYGDIDVAEQLTDRALKFIEDNREGPFFLYLPHWDVHLPYQAREAVVQRYKDKLEKLPEDQRRNFNPVYAAMIEAVDQSVRRVVAKVDELGIADDTLIVFTSDNGGVSWVSQLAPLRGTKGSLFEAGVRVPMVMRWPGKIEPGSTCQAPITSVDFLPTFVRLAGGALPRDQPVDGVDITPLMRGNEIAERSIFWHYPLYLSGKGLEIDVPGGQTHSWRGFPSTSIRRGDWKLIEFHEDNSVALYNLNKDPGEQKNLAQAKPELAASLRKELDQWQADTGAPIPTVKNPECVLPAK